ncbi:MAG: hypothetical protein NTW19_01590 [Planctomycetota bacterium]|nr:hypothetical protein [Planctomycetota bacterium]
MHHARLGMRALCGIAAVVGLAMLSAGCDDRSANPPPPNPASPATAPSKDPIAVYINHTDLSRLEMISETRCELKSRQGGAIFGECTREDGRLRVELLNTGERKIRHFSVAPEGLIDVDGNLWTLQVGVPYDELDVFQRLSWSQAEELHKACVAWSSKADANYPPDLGALVEAKLVPPQAVVSPFDKTPVPSPLRDEPLLKQAEWANQNSSYAYVPGQKNGADGKLVTVFEKINRAKRQTGIPLCYNDGKVEWRSLSEARTLIKQQTGKSLEEWSK